METELSNRNDSLLLFTILLLLDFFFFFFFSKLKLPSDTGNDNN